MPKEIYKSAYSLAKEAELHLQLAQKCLRSLDATVNDALQQATSVVDAIAGQNESSLSATTDLANELKQSIERLKLSEQTS
ncbi:hypothetical protein BCT86_15625 [Vibrio breoganii]|uniref:Uncharacterized protein n=1 Tax=Vibrio breoganii TaxID=553239 RepID=A0AAN0XY25_9VIBR|nr:hypothetical protein [Vibrio breoganii]ANO34765.1 hypothetical protein A6E01_16370 [Vibrio breoganii]OED91610.1 hypothetical protein A1QE_01345 [Vibrio breoganii ZF-55]PMG77704.1 hypothetical protein BCU83_01930 [Vibrio breoganii]PMK42211.1 hypothetical protein BCU00_13255 [Vibrio breoganii]PML04143.1 hypothetical protein BCT86_15625 [Vibrio breoganii]